MLNISSITSDIRESCILKHLWRIRRAFEEAVRQVWCAVGAVAQVPARWDIGQVADVGNDSSDR